ncbi:MAG: hypothetical protein MUF28_05545 [Ignavibacterium sp.]|nr:hypothetical protein [Ignavibacterium sp.]
MNISSFSFEIERNDIPAIVLGCHKIGLGIIRALGQRGIPVIGAYYNELDMGYVSKYIVEKFKFTDPNISEISFINELKEISKKYKGAVLFASDDTTLLAVSKNKKALADLFRVEAPDWETTNKFIDKQYTYALAHKIGVYAPRTFLPNSFEEAGQLVKELEFPCLLKPSVGHLFFNTFKKKMLFISNHNELAEAYKKIGNFNVQMMLQEFIPGNDTHGANYNSLFVKGKPFIEFTSEKVRLSPPRTGFPRVIISKFIEEVIEPGRKMLAELKYDGFSCMEFKKDSRSGNYVFMEINGRQNLSTPLAVKCGLNFPYITYRKIIDGSLPNKISEFKRGVYWIDTGKDIVESIRSFKEEHFNLMDYLRPYLNPNVHTIPDLMDLRPLLKRFLDGILQIPKVLLNK